MKIKYFNTDTIKTIEDLKSAFRALAKKHHPDLNQGVDTTEIMKTVNCEYEFLFNSITNGYTTDKQREDHKAKFHDLKDGYREFVSKIIYLDNIVIELNGSWIWVSYELADFEKINLAMITAGAKLAKSKNKFYW